ncbi:metallophosphoesterase family protein [Gracilibacillus sp. S3-1-1]|uniref:Metallophosphoesterase family protein n=1 Tax=Gracilibacillus pellucidus TaxID=3095368 RepID=A0ACC6M0M8_9BACI|nr:metallophosphoesterase family protein [Gracilibacillus sp. S3-1-1]MDX8044503.1 metallophosphoesterase family protein [Gracilibacillus sp. S3-1-1]
MKIAFISDIHGNRVALEAVLQDVKKNEVDRVIVLGDIAYRGPEPGKSIDLIRNLQTDVVKGNADEWVTRGVRQGEVPDHALTMMQEEQAWINKQLNDEQLTYLKELPSEISIEVEGVRIHAFHATPDSLFDVVLPDVADDTLIEKLTSKEEADLYLYGHIHKAYQRIVGGKTIINLGSVGLPFDGIAKASYCLIDITDGQVQTSHIRVPYDIEKVCKQYEEVNYPNIAMMQNIIRTGRN